MKQFLNLVFSLALLLSSAGAFARDCGRSTNCESTCNTNFGTNCNFNNCDLNACNFNCDNKCDDSCSRSCSISKDCSRDCETCEPRRTGLHYRSQGANTARELVGWQWDINRFNCGQNYTASYLAFEYTRSFRSCRLAEAIFGRSIWRFEGSLVPNRTPGALVADNFGLSRNFQGSIRFRPRIENYIVDLGWYVGLDCVCPGLFFRLHAPIVHTRWRLNTDCNDCCDVICTTTGFNNPFDPCYVSSSAASCATLNEFGQPVGAAGCLVPVNNATSLATIEEALNGVTPFGDKRLPWSAGRFDFCSRKRTGLADIDLIFGYNWINDACHHFGGFIQAVIPTGTKQNNRFVFDPVVGNGGHFELGAGLTAHTTLWSCDNSNLGLFFEGNVTHMFRRGQCRLFDFCNNGYLSRYLLLKEFVDNGTSLSYTGNLVSATNFNNRRVDVRIDVKGDASIKLAYRWCGFGFDLGYNIYGHSHEKIRLRCRDQRCVRDGNKVYGIKGTTGVCCFNYPLVFSDSVAGVVPAGTSLVAAGLTACNPNLIPTGVTTVTALPDTTTQPDATAFTLSRTLGTIDRTDCQVCVSPAGNTAITGFTPTSTLGANGFVVPTQAHPGLVSDADLNLRSAEAPAALTHKVFGHLNYSWDNCCWGNPHIGIGAEGEFASNKGRGFNCRRAAVSQWGVWVKGGVSF